MGNFARGTGDMWFGVLFVCLFASLLPVFGFPPCLSHLSLVFFFHPACLTRPLSRPITTVFAPFIHVGVWQVFQDNEGTETT